MASLTCASDGNWPRYLITQGTSFFSMKFFFLSQKSENPSLIFVFRYYSRLAFSVMERLLSHSIFQLTQMFQLLLQNRAFSVAYIEYTSMFEGIRKCCDPVCVFLQAARCENQLLNFYLQYRQYLNLKMSHQPHSPSLQPLSTSTLTPQQLAYVKAHTMDTSNLEYVAAQLQQQIHQNFGIDRPVDLIREYLRTVEDSEIGDDRHSGSLFKVFESGKKQVVDISRMRRKAPVYFVSQRKVARKQVSQQRINMTLQQKLDQIESMNQNCSYSFDKVDRKLNKKTSIRQTSDINPNVQWFYNEHFYSNYDRRYFSSSAMRAMYQQLDLKPGESTYRAHRKIMQALPKPVLFSEDFVNLERLSLQNFRNQCRSSTKNLSKNNESTTDFPVHSIVLALHPLCGHLHTGSIMAYYKDNLYMVKFLKAELLVQKIMDINISTQFTSLSNKIYSRQGMLDRDRATLQHQNPYEIIENINFDMTSFLIKLLSYKNQLVKLMKSVNDRVEKKDRKENISPESASFVETNLSSDRELFQYIVRIVAKLNIIINQVKIRFRLRGVNQANANTVYGNIKNLLLNPLKLMSKQFENSNEEVDRNAAQQIRHIINKQRDSQIRKVLSSAMALSNTNTNRVPSQKQKQIIEMIHACLGILADLRFQGKGFDVKLNPNLIKLAYLAGDQNKESFNDVYERLFSIVAKIKE